MPRYSKFASLLGLFVATASPYARAGDGGSVKIGLNYDKTGPYSAQGLDQFQAAQLAVDEINASGGILGRKIELIMTDGQSNAAISTQNAEQLIGEKKVKMIFGGSASSVANAVCRVASSKKVPFFATLAYSTDVTGEEARKYCFRECYDSYAGARALEGYMRKNFNGKKFFYVTARYTWGYTTEKSIRKFSNTESVEVHRHVYTPFPKATDQDFVDAIKAARDSKADVLVLVLFGDDMVRAMKQAHAQGLTGKMKILVPNLTLGMAERAGAEIMEGVVGAIPWTAKVPSKYNFAHGKQFVSSFASRYSRLPDTSGASAYTILYEYKAAVERAHSFDPDKVVAALENHTYTSLKDSQTWRSWDHQSVQTVYTVRVKSPAEVAKDPYQLDYFEIMTAMKGNEAFISRADWETTRKGAGKPLFLEP